VVVDDYLLLGPPPTLPLIPVLEVIFDPSAVTGDVPFALAGVPLAVGPLTGGLEPEATQLPMVDLLLRFY
jgi:hypothetical protein